MAVGRRIAMWAAIGVLLVLFVPGTALADSADSSATTSTTATATTETTTPTSACDPATSTGCTATVATCDNTPTLAGCATVTPTVTETPAVVANTAVEDAPSTCPTTECITVEEFDSCVDATCVPEAAVGAGGVASAIGTGTGALPFTGVRDLIAAGLLAATILFAAMLLYRWARVREAIARAAGRRQTPAWRAPSGYGDAVRMLEVERRARSMFAPHIA